MASRSAFVIGLSVCFGFAGFDFVSRFDRSVDLIIATVDAMVDVDLVDMLSFSVMMLEAVLDRYEVFILCDVM